MGVHVGTHLPGQVRPGCGAWPWVEPEFVLDGEWSVAESGTVLVQLPGLVVGCGLAGGRIRPGSVDSSCDGDGCPADADDEITALLLQGAEKVGVVYP